MGGLIKVAVLENEFEAGLVDQILSERLIPHTIRSYHDYAYNGIFQFQKGWGYVEAPEEYADEIIGIINDIRSGKPIDSDEDPGRLDDR